MVVPSTRVDPRSSRVAFEREADGLAGPCGSIDGPDDLDRFTPLAAINQRGAILVDGEEEIGELVAVAGVVDAPRVAGAGLEAGGGGEPGHDLGVAGGGVAERPEGEVVLFD